MLSLRERRRAAARPLSVLEGIDFAGGASSPVLQGRGEALRPRSSSVLVPAATSTPKKWANSNESSFSSESFDIEVCRPS